MKQLLSSKLQNILGQLLPSEKRKAIKEFFSAKVCAPVKQLLSSEFFQNLIQRIPEKVRKFLLPALLLLLALIIGLSRCSANQTPPEQLIGNVSIEVLNVHKKTDVTSRILGQLPYDLEIEILEEKTVKDTTWGLIDQVVLPDGTTVKTGWVDLHYIDFSSDDVIEEIPEPEPEVPVVEVNMGTVTADKLNVRKGPDSGYEATGAYYKGDRVEILETKVVEGTTWGRTNLGWVGMGYVRMDGTAVDDNPNLSTDGNINVLGYGIVNLRELNVRQGPGTEYFKVRSVGARSRYAYYQLQDGWARIEDGWVSLEFFYLEGTMSDSAITGTVTAEELNIRSGPNTTFNNIGQYKKGEVIEILAQVDNWGYTESGWVFMNYVEPVKPVYSTGSGTIANGLNIRQTPSAEAEIVDTYTTGDRVTILEVMDNWGKTDKGWINLKYVIFDAAEAVPSASETIPAST